MGFKLSLELVRLGWHRVILVFELVYRLILYYYPLNFEGQLLD